MRGPTRERLREGLRWVLAAAYLAAGIIHIRSPAGFLAITPDWVPAPRFVILATGLCEIAGAIALCTRRLRWWAGTMLALYAVCVYPANLNHAINHIAVGGTRLGLWYHVPRLLAQPLVVWWALFAGRVIDWPMVSRRA